MCESHGVIKLNETGPKNSSQLKVYYDGYAPAFEERLIEFLESEGFSLWASGHNIIINRRDLAFESPY